MRKAHIWMVNVKVKIDHNPVSGSGFPMIIKSDSVEVAEELAKRYLEKHKACQEYEIEGIEKLEYLGEFDMNDEAKKVYILNESGRA